MGTSISSRSSINEERKVFSMQAQNFMRGKWPVELGILPKSRLQGDP